MIISEEWDKVGGGSSEHYYEEEGQLSTSLATTINCGFQPKRIEMWTYFVTGAGAQVYRIYQFYDVDIYDNYVILCAFNNSTNAGYSVPQRNSITDGNMGNISSITSTGFTLAKNQYPANYCVGYKVKAWG